MSYTTRLTALLVVFVVVMLCFWVLSARKGHPFIKLVVLARYSVLVGAAQLGLGLLALFHFPIGRLLLQNIFILDNAYQLCNVTWMSLLLGTTIVVTFRTIKINGKARFLDYAEARKARSHFYKKTFEPVRKNYWRLRWWYVAVLASPLLVAAFRLTWHDMIGNKSATAETPWVLAGFALLGVLIWFLILILVTFLQKAFLGDRITDVGLFPLDQWALYRGKRLTSLDGIAEWLARTAAKLGPGYSYNEGGQWYLRPGHAQLAIYFCLLMTAYVIALFFVPIPQEGQALSSLFAILTMLQIFALLATGLSFLLDYFRIPLLLAVFLFSLGSWTLTKADSYYDLAEGKASKPITLDQVLSKRADGKYRTLVLVTAAGGGIQAAAWAAEVLTGLQEEAGDEFTRSIGVISSVSGGSVGTMFYLDRWSADQAGFPARNSDVLEGIREAAKRSSLEATAWGLSGWDTVKAGTPFLARTLWDRGWAIEESWRRELKAQNATMTDWGERARQGIFPIVVFNSTAVESGQRFLISNVIRPDTPGYFERPKEQLRALEFAKEYQPDMVRVATAARLSATFPYVSPICRPLGHDANAYHLADGGYVDNEGLLSAIDWLDHLVAYRKSSGKKLFDRVLLIRILPFPAGGKPDPEAKAGWRLAFVGPLQTIMNVRGASQIEHNELDLSILPDALWQEDIDWRVAKFTFENQPDSVGPPLSWKLSRVEKKAIHASWQHIVDGANDAAQKDHPLRQVKEWFPTK